ncbi:hypothetical protein PG987_014722 [Apiospora arundinis]
MGRTTSPSPFCGFTLLADFASVSHPNCPPRRFFHGPCSDAHAENDGAQIIESFIHSSFQSERLLLELLDRGLISSEYVSTWLASNPKEVENRRRLAAGLWWAASSRGHKAALSRLVGLGVPVDLKLRTSIDLTRLKYNHHYQVRRIIEQPEDYREEFFETALSMAAARGDVDGVKLLLELGADPNAKDSLGRFPLQLACTDQHWGGFPDHPFVQRFKIGAGRRKKISLYEVLAHGPQFRSHCAHAPSLWRGRLLVAREGGRNGIA